MARLYLNAHEYMTFTNFLPRMEYGETIRNALLETQMDLRNNMVGINARSAGWTALRQSVPEMIDSGKAWKLDVERKELVPTDSTGRIW